MIKRYPRYCGIFIGLVLMMAAGLFCDDGTGSICGKVLKPNGKPAKGAEVNLITEFWSNAKLIASTQTDKGGAFCFHGIAPGNYHIDANFNTHSYSVLCDMQEIELVSNLMLSFELKRDLCLMTCVPAYHELKDAPMTKTWRIEELQSIPPGAGGGR